MRQCGSVPPAVVLAAASFRLAPNLVSVGVDVIGVSRERSGTGSARFSEPDFAGAHPLWCCTGTKPRLPEEDLGGAWWCEGDFALEIGPTVGRAAWEWPGRLRWSPRLPGPKAPNGKFESGTGPAPIVGLTRFIGRLHNHRNEVALSDHERAVENCKIAQPQGLSAPCGRQSGLRPGGYTGAAMPRHGQMGPAGRTGQCLG